MFNGYYAMMNLYFKIIRSIPSRTAEKIVETQDISSHLKRLTHFTIESRKLPNVLAITSFFRIISSFPLSWVVTTIAIHSTKPELRFCAGSNHARGVSEIRDGEDL